MCCVFPCSQEMATSEPAAQPTKEMKGYVESFSVALTKKGIKLLALDFDKTLVDIHSRGLWTDDAQSLASHVRPCMKDLILHAQSKGVYTAIVTYSSQAGLIKEVLHKVLSKKVASKMYVIANTPEFLTRQGWSDLNGKEAHIDTVVSAIEKDHKVSIAKKEILLMDDDMDNVRIAVTSGHLGFHVQQNVDYSSFPSFQTMLLL